MKAKTLIARIPLAVSMHSDAPHDDRIFDVSIPEKVRGKMLPFLVRGMYHSRLSCHLPHLWGREIAGKGQRGDTDLQPHVRVLHRGHHLLPALSMSLLRNHACSKAKGIQPMTCAAQMHPDTVPQNEFYFRAMRPEL